MIQLDKIEDSEGIYLDKTDKSKECKIFQYKYFNNGVLNLIQTFVIDVTGE